RGHVPQENRGVLVTRRGQESSASREGEGSDRRGSTHPIPSVDSVALEPPQEVAAGDLAKDDLVSPRPLAVRQHFAVGGEGRASTGAHVLEAGQLLARRHVPAAADTVPAEEGGRLTVSRHGPGADVGGVSLEGGVSPEGAQAPARGEVPDLKRGF